ncbi:anti-sigma regulatory factor [Leptolyngbya sp. FACHB-261]|nr:anti-sigma regulatory factor [Leptolyngbya sp. FACHB-261]
MYEPGTISIRSTADIVLVRQTVRACTVKLGLKLVDQTKIVTAASELARNTLEHGGGGSLHLETLEEGTRRGLRLTFIDQGPGIANVELALQDGYTTGHGMGMGLGGARRLASEFEIDSKPGKGTRVSITKWK